MQSVSTSYWLYSPSMKTYSGSAKYENVTSLRSSTSTSNFSSALTAVSVPELFSRFLSLSLTTAELRPDLLYSARCTTIGSLPTMITLPVRSSWAVFIDEPWLTTFYSNRCRISAARLVQQTVCSSRPSTKADSWVPMAGRSARKPGQASATEPSPDQA